jgi:hypothetical protein
MTTTTVATTTSSLPPTTPTTPPAPADLRQEFFAELDSEGWISYTDPAVGWSIRYPADWTVAAEQPGDFLVLEIPDGQSFFLVLVGRDAVPGETSLDYLFGNVAYAESDGLLEGTLSEEDLPLRWLDHDFDGVDGPLDIFVWESTWATDLFLEGTPVVGEAHTPTWWYGYYNTDLQPDYGYMLEAIGDIQTLGQTFDDVALSFEPPAD